MSNEKLSPNDYSKIDEQKEAFKKQELVVTKEINKLLTIYNWDSTDMAGDNDREFFKKLDQNEKLDLNKEYKSEIIRQMNMDIIEALERLKNITIK